jgi:hypothetical protein
MVSDQLSDFDIVKCARIIFSFELFYSRHFKIFKNIFILFDVLLLKNDYE